MRSDDSIPIYGWVAGEGASPALSPRPSALNGSGASGRGQLLEGLLVALVPSSLGLVAYAILREAYVWFYQRYTIAPEFVRVPA